MMIRLVKMTFRPEAVRAFQELFAERKHRIRASQGCRHLELIQEVENGTVFFTYSKWDRLEDLEQYRQSDFFKETWALTKALFAEKAEAWTLREQAG